MSVSHHELDDFCFSVRAFEDGSRAVACFDRQHNLLDTFREGGTLPLLNSLRTWATHWDELTTRRGS